MTGETLPALLDRIRAGDQGAATELVRRYEPALRRSVRLRLRDPRLRRVLDSSDVCQAVLLRFFVSFRGNVATVHLLNSPSDEYVESIAEAAFAPT